MLSHPAVMLPGMQTFDESPLLSSFDACAEFAAGDDGSPVCRACGWLAEEHTAGGVADVRVLAPRRPATPAPRRLAS